MNQRNNLIGAEVIDFVKYHEKDTMKISVKFDDVTTLVVDGTGTSREIDIYGNGTTIDGIVKYMKEKTYMKTVTEEVSYMDADFIRVAPFQSETEANFQMIR